MQDINIRIHLFLRIMVIVRCLYFILLRVAVHPELILGTLCVRREYTVDEMPAHSFVKLFNEHFKAPGSPIRSQAQVTVCMVLILS